MSQEEEEERCVEGSDDAQGETGGADFNLPRGEEVAVAVAIPTPCRGPKLLDPDINPTPASFPGEEGDAEAPIFGRKLSGDETVSLQ